jgi:hypothetical protein
MNRKFLKKLGQKEEEEATEAAVVWLGDVKQRVD